VQRKCGPCAAEDEMIASSGPQHRRLVPTSDPAELQADEIGGRIGADLVGVSVAPGPLSPRAQRIAERHLGVSLAGTRIADDHAGHRRAAGERALAVTEGSDISFRRGHLTTATPAGRSLIGHELTHVAQQRSARAARPQKFDPFGAVGSLATGAWNVAGDAVDTGLNVTGDALSTGYHVAGDVATGDFAKAGHDLQSGASSALGHVVSGAESASTDAATGIAGATNALLGDLGIHAGVSGTGLSISVDDIELFDSFDIPIIDVPEWSTFIPFIGGAIPVGPVVLGGALGFMVRVKPQLMGSLGPGWLRNIAVTIDPLHLTTTATAQLYVAGAIGPRVALSGALTAMGGIAIPDPPILVIAGVEGGLIGTGRGSALAALQITVSGGFTRGRFSFKADNRLRFGVHLMGSLDAYVAATLYTKIICQYIWRLLQWSGGPAWELSIPLSMSGLSRPKIGPVGFGRFPIGNIEHGITEPPTGGHCLGWDEIKKLLCEVGVIPPEHCKDKDESGDKLHAAAKDPIPCSELPALYEFTSYDAAEKELKSRTGLSTVYPGPWKDATRGPCSKSSGYEVGGHRNVYKDSAKKEQVGSIGRCKCSSPGGGASFRYAVLNP
jgi:hypothetical protein